MPPRRARTTAQKGPPEPCPFDRLSDDVLLRIIRHTRALAQRDAQELKDQRFTRVTRVFTMQPGTDNVNHAWAHSLEGDPILSCFQALAVANRRFYKLSKPLLWEVRGNQDGSVFWGAQTVLNCTRLSLFSVASISYRSPDFGPLLYSKPAAKVRPPGPIADSRG